jgi:hypothetical protein
VRPEQRSAISSQPIGKRCALWIGTTIVLCSILLTGAVIASAGFEIPWFTVDGGGGAASGGAYTLAGTIGQPDVGSLSGGGYTLSGGFWLGVAAPYPVYLPVVMKSKSF